MSDQDQDVQAIGTVHDEEAAMAAAFAEARGDPTPPAQMPDQSPGDPQAEGGPQAAPQEQVAPAADQAPPVQSQPQRREPTIEERIAAIEASNRSLRQGVDSVAGRLGGIHQQIQRNEQRQPPHDAQQSNVRLAQKITADRLKRVNEDYPGLAESLASDLNELITATPADGAAPPQIDIEAIQSAAEYAAVSRVERRLLNRDHPQWEVDIALKDELGRPLRDASGRYLPSPVLLEWLDTKPEHFRSQFSGAVDADFLSSCLREFKEYRATRQGSPSARPAAMSAPAPADVAPASSNKQARLQAAVTPRAMAPGVTPANPQLTEEQAMERAFRSVRGI